MSLKSLHPEMSKPCRAMLQTTCDARMVFTEQKDLISLAMVLHASSTVWTHSWTKSWNQKIWSVIRTKYGRWNKHDNRHSPKYINKIDFFFAFPLRIWSGAMVSTCGRPSAAQLSSSESKLTCFRNSCYGDVWTQKTFLLVDTILATMSIFHYEIVILCAPCLLACMFTVIYQQNYIHKLFSTFTEQTRPHSSFFYTDILRFYVI